MRTERVVEVLHASSIMRAIAYGMDDLTKADKLHGLANLVEQDATIESESGVAVTRTMVADLRERMFRLKTLHGQIIGEALCGVIHLLIPKD